MSKQEWKEKHQPFELAFHNQKVANPRWDDDDWNSRWDKRFAYVELKEPALDVGCGSRPPLVGRVKQLYGIEPLAGEFNVPKEWFEGIEIRKTPAEEFIEDFQGKFSFVLCWNVLDHTYDWRKILGNIHRYMKDDATLLLATDTQAPHEGHPGVGSKDAFLRKLGELFEVASIPEASRDVTVVCRKK